MPEPGVRAPELLPPALWREREQRHAAVVDSLTEGHLRRASEHRKHPVEDFLFTYYSLRPSRLRRWFPGAGVALADAPERAGWRFHTAVHLRSAAGPVTAVTLDIPGYLAERRRQLDLTRRLLTATASAPAQFGCFGLHEWAMVYRADPDRIRHEGWPLRLGRSGTDEVVAGHHIRCSHYDAFRFFTPQARPRNALRPAPDNRESLEQPGCLHAGMDLYKWAYKLQPAVPGELLLDCFRLARDIRELDMRASPYDLTTLGYSPVCIETAQGKAEYVAAQREFAERGQALRARLLLALHALG